MKHPKPARANLALARAVAARACRGVVIDALSPVEQQACDERTDGALLVRVARDVGALLEDLHTDAELALVAARATWELMPDFDLIGRDWIDDPRRRFLAPPPRYFAGYRAVFDSSPIGSNPGFVGACIALAADASNVLAAEALVRDVTRAGRIGWRFVSAGTFAALASAQGDAAAYAHLNALGYRASDVLDDTAIILCPPL